MTGPGPDGPAPGRTPAAELLGLDDAELDGILPQLTPGVVEAVRECLVRYEDALGSFAR